MNTDNAGGTPSLPLDTDGYLADAVKREEERQQDMAEQIAGRAPSPEPMCPRCWRPVSDKGAQTCDRPHGTTPPARTTS